MIGFKRSAEAEKEGEMKRILTVLGLAAGVLVMAGLAAPAAAEEKKPTMHLVAIYQVAPGKHLDFLKWMAVREVVAKEAGAPASMWFSHTDGAGWDYISITPEPDEAKKAEIGKKTEVLLKQKGLTSGFKSSLEFRQFVSSHSDTYAMGPWTATEMVKAAE